MLLLMWFLVALGPVLGIATAGYDTSCFTYATTASTTMTVPPVTLSTTVTVPPTTIIETSPVATVTLSGRDLPANPDSVTASPSLPSSAGEDLNVTLDAWLVQTLVRCGDSTSTLYKTMFWSTASEPPMTGSINSYTLASTSSGLSSWPYESVMPSPYSPGTEVSFTSYSESSITSAIESYTTASPPPYNASPGYSPSTYDKSSFSGSTPMTASSSAESTPAISSYTTSNFSPPSYTPSPGSIPSTETTMSTYPTPSLPSYTTSMPPTYVTPSLSSYTTPSLQKLKHKPFGNHFKPSIRDLVNHGNDHIYVGLYIYFEQYLGDALGFSAHKQSSRDGSSLPQSSSSATEPPSSTGSPSSVPTGSTSPSGTSTSETPVPSMPSASTPWVSSSSLTETTTPSGMTTTTEDATDLPLPSTVDPTPSRPADEPSSEPEPSLTPTFSSSLSTTSTLSSVPFTPTPSANVTGRIIIPHHKFKVGEADYFLPLCSDPAQVLWFTTGDNDQRELHNFTLTCRGITCDSGEFFPFPTEILSGNCQDTTMCGGLSFCFWRRFEWEIDPGTDTVTCDNVKSSRLQSRGPCLDNDVCSNITKIADKLAGLRNAADAASSAAEQGLAVVGCAAQQAFEQTAAYYFGMVQKEWGIIAGKIEMIKMILTTIFGLNKQVTTPVQLWIDENDEAFQELACYVDDSGSRIWRAMEKHSSLHLGLNALNSMNNIINRNLIVQLFELVFTNMIKDIYDQYSAYITSSGHIVQGWTQAWRLCTTKWDSLSLENTEEKPDEDDEDEWLPRYEIFTKPDASVSSLRSMERVLANQGWEAAHDGHVIKGYVVDLNIMQAMLPYTMPFVDRTQRFVWRGPKSDSKSTESGFQAELNLRPLDTGKFTSRNASRNKSAPAESEPLAQDFEPSQWPEPTGSQRTRKPREDHFKSLSQQKGQEPGSFDYYTYAEPQGEGSWIFVVDSGFDTTHPYLAATDYREVKTYVVPNEFGVPKLTPEHIEQGWEPAPDIIDDDNPDLKGQGHGTSVACAAGGLGEAGVAPRANLYLFKYTGYLRNTKTGEVVGTDTTDAGLVKVLNTVAAIVASDDIPLGRVVVSLGAVWKLEDHEYFNEVFKWFLEEMDEAGVVVVLAAGNRGYNMNTGKPDYYQSESTPQCLVTDNSPSINVGATYHDGSLAEFTTPQGTPGPDSNPDDPSISIWAQGVDVWTCGRMGGDTPGDPADPPMEYRTGTSYSTPIVAGLAAYMLSYPWPENQNPFAATLEGGGSVGRRMKTMLADTYAYQRLPRDKLVAQALEQIQKRGKEEFPWEVPARVNVAYNMAYGHQKCKKVEGFPNLKRDADSCPVPGSGGADGEATGSIFYTGNPIYMPTDWTGFSTATGSIVSPTQPTADPSTFMTSTTPSSDTTSSSIGLPSSSLSSSTTTSKSLSTVSWTLTLNPSTSSDSSTSSTSESTTSSSSTSSSSTPTPTPTAAPAAHCRQYPDPMYHLFKITDISGDWAIGDEGAAIREHASGCLDLQRWVWWQPDSAGLAGMDVWVLPADNQDIKDSECLALAMKQAGGPDDSFCLVDP
ncbi:hypothetical protein DHEL01_v202472 [Diaporthe helianthi]|uniref:Peptidase S8/S53 domain-containing protein n=1 Tax=Diaporthe helianthi TaxID=158607 RepID=A0A2P5I9H2_DIAHE|nr:hypothetical protein DHEL01_v202472 [Diaporthe helianthi]